MDELVSLCKRRGFIFQSSEIYGGLAGVYDYGPLGIELKNNLKRAWWNAMVYMRDDVEGLDSAILTNPMVFKHSGHEDTFTDPLVDCRKCKARMRFDHLKDGKCMFCGSTDLTEPRPFNLMFKTNVGPIDDGSNMAYLRPETAQGIFINFRNVLDTTSRKVPFGIAQVGKSFRNEITPRNFIFRVREFEQMELEFFVEPGTDEKWHEYWIEARFNWWVAQGIDPKNLIKYNQEKDELSHYSKACVDLLYAFPHGDDELEGIANRQDFDLGSHTKAQEEMGIKAHVKENKDSTAKMNYTDPVNKKSYVPFVIEPSAGVDRGTLAIINEAYTVEKLENGEERVVMKFRPHLAPIKLAIIPLARNNDEIVKLAHEIKDDLLKLGLGRIMLENSGNIGKSYRRHDEIGTPLCVTVDFETIEKDDKTVTVRNRDTMAQERVAISDLASYVKNFYSGI